MSAQEALCECGQRSGTNSNCTSCRFVCTERKIVAELVQARAEITRLQRGDCHQMRQRDEKPNPLDGRFIFPFKIFPWDSLTTDGGNTVHAGKGENSVGFLPVYDSIQALVEAHGKDCPSGTLEQTAEASDDPIRHAARRFLGS